MYYNSAGREPLDPFGRPYSPTDPFNPNNQGKPGRTDSVSGGLVIAALILAAFLVISAVGAVVGGVVLIALTRLYRWNRPWLGYKEAYLASLFGFLAYGLVRYLQGQLVGGDGTVNVDWTEDAAQIAANQTLPLIACAIAFGRMLGDPYTGVLGFLRAMLAAIVSLLISLIVIAGVLYYVGEPDTPNRAARRDPFALSGFAYRLAVVGVGEERFTVPHVRLERCRSVCLTDFSPRP